MNTNSNSNVERTAATAAGQQTSKPPRIWPIVALVVVFWAFYLTVGRLGLPIAATFMSQAGAELGLLVLFPILWLTNRRIPRAERWMVFGVAVLGCITAMIVAQQTLSWVGVLIFAVPWVFTLWAACLVIGRSFSSEVRRVVTIFVISLPWLACAVIRMDGLTGDLQAKIRWRWSSTPEDAFLAERAKSRGAAQAAEVKPAAAMKPVELQPGDWPIFRGPLRNGEVRGVKIGTDWQQHPPTLVWKKLVGPAWSSMIVVDGRLFSQEQHGEQEAVICVDANTGEEIWVHEDAARWHDTQSGAGPRATPMFADGYVYTMGGTGVLNCLDAATGKPRWSRNIVTDTQAPLPMWGFSSSPLVVDGKVIVFAGGKDEKGLVAYDAQTGEPAWHAATGPVSYTSAQLTSADGHSQIVFVSDEGVIAVEPATGAVCWKYDAPAREIWRAVQPTTLGDKRVLIGAGDIGLVSLAIEPNDQGFTAKPLWKCTKVTPEYNDVVILDGSIYGFSGGIFACVDSETGKPKWKGGRYGHGQVLLLADQKLLLVTTEESGEAVLVRATPEKHEELARFQTIQGKMWNHPAIAHGRLYVRSDEEMACYQLPPAEAE